MGITYVDAEATGLTGKRAPVRLMVDSGASYSLLPEDVWRTIELEPTRELSFSLADGTQISRNISRCWLSLEHGEDYSPVILGEPGDIGLLGFVTLAILGLVLNPFSRTLHPMRGVMWRSAVLTEQPPAAASLSPAAPAPRHDPVDPPESRRSYEQEGWHRPSHSESLIETEKIIQCVLDHWKIPRAVLRKRESKKANVVDARAAFVYYMDNHTMQNDAAIGSWLNVKPSTLRRVLRRRANDGDTAARYEAVLQDFLNQEGANQ